MSVCKGEKFSTKDRCSDFLTYRGGRLIKVFNSLDIDIRQGCSLSCSFKLTPLHRLRIHSFAVWRKGQTNNMPMLG